MVHLNKGLLPSPPTLHLIISLTTILQNFFFKAALRFVGWKLHPRIFNCSTANGHQNSSASKMLVPFKHKIAAHLTCNRGNACHDV